MRLMILCNELILTFSTKIVNIIYLPPKSNSEILELLFTDNITFGVHSFPMNYISLFR